MHKNEFMDWMVNNIQLVWKLVYMFRKYRICNSTVEFLKYNFINKLLSGVILFKVTSDVKILVNKNYILFKFCAEC